MSIDVVIVAFRNEDVIGRCVDAARTLGGTVVVVDHGDGASAAVAARHGAHTIVNPDNPGFGAGQNRGVRETSTPYVLLCNPDAVPDGRVIEAAVALFDRRADVGAIQGVIVNSATGRPERSAGAELGPVHLIGRALGVRRLKRFALVRRLALRSPTLHDHVDRAPARPTDVESLAATALVVRRAAYDDVGGFDERYFLYGEDLDLGRRLRGAGWRLVALPEVWAKHVSGASASSLLGRELTWWEGTLTFAARWWPTDQWRLALLAAFLRVVGLTAMHPTRAGAIWRAVIAKPRSARSSNEGIVVHAEY
jgi:N-acetylglucosaminyl-diphospho-decaprenol L-rhamnosyltransferase